MRRVPLSLWIFLILLKILSGCDFCNGAEPLKEDIDIATPTSPSTPSTSALSSNVDEGTPTTFLNSSMDEIATELHGVPGNPTDVACVAYDSRVEISWKAPEDDGGDIITTYEIAAFDDMGKPFDIPVIVISSSDPSKPPQTLSVIDNLKNGVSYTFKIRSQNKYGYSTWSAKSDPVTPLHPADLCAHISCSGLGQCFPNYVDVTNVEGTETDDDAKCVCKDGYRLPDCSTPDKTKVHAWDVTQWGKCSSGCGGGQKMRKVTCVSIIDGTAVEESNCNDKKPISSQICSGMTCGSKLIDVSYEIEMNYDEVIFSHDSLHHFEEAFTNEIASALDISRSRIEILSIERGSIKVRFLILPPLEDQGRELSEVVEMLQVQLKNSFSKLRTKGTFARKVDPTAVQLTYFIAEENATGGEDISIAGLIGTVIVLVCFISAFAYFLRKRHERLMLQGHAKTDSVMHASRKELRPMDISSRG